MVCRNPAKGAAARGEIAAASGSSSVELMIADLSSQRSIRELAAAFKEKYPRLDVLVNNAGGNYGRHVVTEDGLEYTFAVNHLAYFLLTDLLLEVLKASTPARIINLTSGAERVGRIDFHDLQSENRRYSGMRAYSQSKLANVLFTYELARRVEGTGVTANCVHPGVVRTNFGRHMPRPWRYAVTLMLPFMKSPAKGADTVLYLASAPEAAAINGQYVVNRKVSRSSARSYDQGVARRLWEVSAALTRLSP
jgi:NAD(P)-dependent dehydrogenase (short-subunit alcohol dehydrogenase family)